jgi:hypothetical protein
VVKEAGKKLFERGAVSYTESELLAFAGGKETKAGSTGSGVDAQTLKYAFGGASQKHAGILGKLVRDGKMRKLPNGMYVTVGSKLDKPEKKKEAPKTMTEVVKEATKEGLQPNIDKDKERKVPSLDGATYHDTLDVDDYPYGRERTKAKFSVETMKNGNQRGVMQTLNPKTGRWNKPKKTTSGSKVKIVQADGRTYIATDHGSHIEMQSAAGFKSAGNAFSEGFARNDSGSEPGHHELHVGIHGESEAQSRKKRLSRISELAGKMKAGAKTMTDVVKEAGKPKKNVSALPEGMEGFAVDAKEAQPKPAVHSSLGPVGLASANGKRDSAELTKEHAKTGMTHDAKLLELQTHGLLTTNADGSEDHANDQAHHADLASEGHVEDLGQGVYGDKVPEKAQGKKGKVLIDQGFTDGKPSPKKEVSGTIYGKGAFAIVQNDIMETATGKRLHTADSKREAEYMMSHIMHMEKKGHLDTMDANDMYGKGKAATESLSGLLAHIKDEKTSYVNSKNNPVWKRRATAEKEANRRKKVSDLTQEAHEAHSAAPKTEGGRYERHEAHADKESAHKRAKAFYDEDSTRSGMNYAHIVGAEGSDKHMVATDGHRLAMIPVAKDASGGMKYDSYEKKTVETDKYDARDFVNTAAFTKTPNVEPHTFDAKTLRAQAKLAMSTTNDTNGNIHLFSEGGQHHAQAAHTAATSGHAEENAQGLHGPRLAAFEGKDTSKGEKKAMLNAKYVHDALKGATGNVKVHYKEGEAVHISRDDGERHVIMPMRDPGTTKGHPHNDIAWGEKPETKKSLDTFTDLVKNIDTVRSYMAEGMSARAATKKAYPTYPEAKVDKFLKQYGLNKALGFTKLVQQSPKIYHRRKPGKRGSE